MDCNKGTYEVTLDGENRISGSFKCDDGSKDGEFEGQRTSSKTPSPAECGHLGGGKFDFVGKWNDGFIYTDICIDDANYVETSYDNLFYENGEPGNEDSPGLVVRGLEIGKTARKGQILQLNWYERELSGVSIWLHLEDGSAVSYWWVGNDFDFNNDTHGFDPYKFRDDKRPGDCSRHEYFVSSDEEGGDFPLTSFEYKISDAPPPPPPSFTSAFIIRGNDTASSAPVLSSVPAMMGMFLIVLYWFI